MADTLRIKRRTTGLPGAPAGLANAELAYNEVDHILYYGEGTGGSGGSATTVVPIAGGGMASVTTPIMDGVATIGTLTLWSRGDHVHPTDTSRAPLASPTFTGVPAAPTATPGTSTTQLATTAFVQAAAAASGVTTWNTRSGVVVLLNSDVIAVLPASTITPIMDSVGAAGTLGSWARGDHVHPSDTSRLATSGGTMTNGTLAGTTTNTGTIAGGSLSGIVTLAGTLTGGTLAGSITNSATISGGTYLTPSLNNTKLTNVLDPTNGQDAATKNYVDGLVQGMDAKAPVRLATTTNLAALSGLLTIDGVVTIAGDRVLVKDQTTPSANGIYLVAAGAWTRTTDADTWTELPAAYVFVELGTVNADNGYLCTVDPGGTLGTTAVTWVQFSGAGQVIAGNGLTKAGNQIDVNGTASRILVSADSIDIDPAWVGQVSITTLGTITTGTWNASTIQVNRGGTGATTLTGYVKSAGTVAFTAVATIPNTDISGLGTMSTQNANAVAITGGTISTTTLSGDTLTGTTTNSGTISGGTLSAATVAGGTFSGSITNNATVTSGTQAGTLTLTGTISGGSLNPSALTVSGATSLQAATGLTRTAADSTTNLATTAFVTSAIGTTTTSLSVTISDTAPSSPYVGKLWFDSVGANLYIWHNDGTSSQWVVANSVPVPAPGTIFPAMDNIGSAGVLSAYSRADHVHPSDTSRLAASGGTLTNGTISGGTFTGSITNSATITGGTQAGTLTLTGLISGGTINTAALSVSGATTLSTATGVTVGTLDNSTNLATTAFVRSLGYSTTVGTVTSVVAGAGLNGGTITTAGTLAIATAGVTNAMLANMAASTIKGNNTAGLAAPIDLTVAQAQALLVVPAVNTVTSPIMNSVAAIGTLTTYARADHVHPTDTTRVSNAGDTITGPMLISTGTLGPGLTINTRGGAGGGWASGNNGKQLLITTTPAGNNPAIAITDNTGSVYLGILHSPPGTMRLAGMPVYSDGTTALSPRLDLSATLATFSIGASFGVVSAASTIDLSRHLALFSTTYGFNVGSGQRLNYVSASQHVFITGTTDVVTVNLGGLTVNAGTLTMGVGFATTAAPGTNTTQVATTAFVQAANAAAVLSFNTRTGAVVLTSGDVLAVQPASTITPIMDGAAAVGVNATSWARADHVHPSDTSRLAATGGTFNGGTLTGTTQNNGTINNGSISAPVMLGSWTNSGTINGGLITGSTIDNTTFDCGTF